MGQDTLIRIWIAITILLLTTVQTVTLPDCQTVAPQQKTLSGIRSSFYHLAGIPFGLAYARDNDIAFVALNLNASNSNLGVLNTSTFTPTLIRQIPLPAAYVQGGGALGITLTHDGRHVVISAGSGVIVVNAERAVAGGSDAVVGAVNGTTANQRPGTAAIEVTVSLDDKYAFVSQEYGSNQTDYRGDIDVLELQGPNANGSILGTAVGYLKLGYAVVGTALSPNGHYLYATSESSSENDTKSGLVSIIDVETLRNYPSEAQLSSAFAGCSPVRAVITANGKQVWVTSRESNHLLAFDAARLLSTPSEALIASVQVGTSPVGLILARNDSRILTADSNRFSYANATTGLSVVDVNAALAGEPALLGRIPTGLFPREFAISPDGDTILVSDYLSEEVQSIDVASLP